MTPQVAEDVRQTTILLLAGVVGAGKNTVLSELLLSPEYYKIISHTTRTPRSNHGVMELDHVDYHFITLEEAEKMVKNRGFVEAKYVHGNVYGTSVQALSEARQSGRIAVTDIDIEGVTEYLNIKSDTHAIFLLPPSVETWLERLERRYGNLDEHHEEIMKRFRTAYDEIIKARADSRFILVVNDDLATTVTRIHRIVNGSKHETSEYAQVVTDHLLDFLKTKIKS